MKKTRLILGLSLIALFTASCSDNDYFDQEKYDELIKSAFPIENVDASQDWNMLTSGEVSIKADANADNIVKVEVLTGNPYLVSDAKVLNEIAATNGQTVTLKYDAPSYLTTLYAVCITNNDEYVTKPFSVGTTSTVSFQYTVTGEGVAGETETSEMKTRANSNDPSITNHCSTSFNRDMRYRNWEPWIYEDWNDYLYTTNLSLSVIDYPATERENDKAIFQKYVPENNNNLSKVNSENYYMTTTGGEDAVTIFPVYKNTGSTANVLYYYYFKASDIENKTEDEQIEYLQSLPKFRIYGATDITTSSLKRNKYNLAYFPTVGRRKTGTYQFPAGYKIGLMLKNDKAELYSDGRLNNSINTNTTNSYSGWNIKGVSGYKTDMSRTVIFGANSKNYVGFEDWNDCDFNDIVFSVDGAVEDITTPDEVKPDTTETQTYTYCFEDNFPEPGDYDFNDLVLYVNKTTDKNVVTLNVTLKAVGATKQLGAALHLNGISKSEVSSVVSDSKFHNAVESESALVPYTTTNLTQSKSGEAVIPLFDDAHYAMNSNSVVNGVVQRYFYNTVKYETNEKGKVVSAVKSTYTITFNSEESAQKMTVANMDIFAVESYNGANWEVHTYPYKTTEVMNEYISKKYPDAYNDNYPWAICVPGTFKYPIEWQAIGKYSDSVISGAYSESGHSFSEWAINKENATDWYNYPTSGLVY